MYRYLVGTFRNVSFTFISSGLVLCASVDGMKVVTKEFCWTSALKSETDGQIKAEKSQLVT
jgi:hypothetical protein